MSEKFKQLKRKYLLAAVLKSIVCGLSLALLAVGGVMLALKLTSNSLDVIWYVLIGVGCLLVGGAVAFIFFRPTNKKVATRLDNEFGLEERVQTSLEYSEGEGVILQLQREDTEEKLQTLPKAKFKLAGIWQLGVVVIVALAIAVTGFVIPKKQVVASGGTLPPEELPAVVTEYHVTSVRSMLTNVRDSRLEGEIRTSIVYELEDLLNTLTGVYEGKEEYEGFTQGQLDNAVLKTIDGVGTVVYSYVNYEKLATAMKDLGENYLSAIVQAGGDAYRSYELKKYGHVETFYSQREDATKTRIEAAISPLRELLSVKLEDGLGVVVNGTASAALSALDPTLLGVERTDTTYTILNSFVTDLLRIGRDISNDKYVKEETNEEGETVTVLDDTGVQKDLDEKFESFKGQLAAQLSRQAYYGSMRRYISNELRIIFGLGGIEEAEDFNVGGNGGNEGGEKEEEDPNGTGGIGSGDTKHSGEDEIYDPDQGKRVKYYDIMARYWTILKELKDSGAITQEQYDMAAAYFQFMFGSEKAES